MGILFGSYGGNDLNFLLLRRKTVALIPIDWVAGQTFCDNMVYLRCYFLTFILSNETQIGLFYNKKRG
jgi:hypothetical protein